MAALLLAACLALQTPREAIWLAEADAARRAMGVPPFRWDDRLAECAREAVRNDWDMHEHFAARAAKYGAAAEGSFPGVYSLREIFDLMRTHPRLSRGPHAKHFRDPAHTRVGIAFGGDGPTSDGPFWIIVYGR